MPGAPGAIIADLHLDLADAQWVTSLYAGLLTALLPVPETRGEKKRPGVDVDGALLSAITFGALVFAVIEGPDLGWWTPKQDLTILGWVWSTRADLDRPPRARGRGARPGTVRRVGAAPREGAPLGPARSRTVHVLDVLGGNVTAAMVAVGEFALIFVLPLYLINALGLDVMGAGLVLAAMAAGTFLSGAAARHLAARFGAPGTVLIGLGLEVAGVVVLALLLGPDTSGWLVAVPLVVYGLGLGLASAQLTGTVLQDIPVEISGQGSATQSTVRQIGSALGTAFAGATLSVALAATLPAALDDAGLTGPAADSLASATRDSAGTTIPQLRAQGGARPARGAHGDRRRRADGRLRRRDALGAAHRGRVPRPRIHRRAAAAPGVRSIVAGTSAASREVSGQGDEEA
ncbi:MFS transporter [Micrococcus luteus]|uniref:MFS transporter n=1 Tax=Micrococcus luteus TaxID=1270 RepID=UPI0015F07C8E|nr:MFS transporter [Micrococcus luteus]